MSKKKFYGLFVGVDDYSSASVPKLQGCVNDAKKMLNFIQNTYKTTYDLNITRFFSPREGIVEQSEGLPTKANIIQKLLDYSDKTKSNISPGDIVFLFYAGHGSTEAAHPYFKEPTGTLQTLVPYDSRIIDPKTNKPIRDILDKEIRVLIHKIWTNTKAEIIFIQDSCHSAGASRNDDIETAAQLLEEKIFGKVTVTEPENATNKPRNAFNKEPIVVSEVRTYTPKTETIETTENKVREVELKSDRYDSAMLAPRLCAGDGLAARSIEEILGIDLEKKQELDVLNQNFEKEIDAIVEKIKQYPERVRAIAETVTDENVEATIRNIATTEARNLYEKPFELAFPEGEHVHISACGQLQYAYETTSTDEVTGIESRGGVFTNAVTKLLRKANGMVSYQDIYQHSKLYIDGLFQQTPSIYVCGEESKKHRLFLGAYKEKAEGVYNLIFKEKENCWITEAGAFTGLPLLREGTHIPAIAYNINNVNEQYSAIIDYVRAESSIVTFSGGEPPKGAIYKLKVEGAFFIAKPIKVLVEKAPIALDKLAKAFETTNINTSASKSEANFSVRPENGWLILSKNNAGKWTELFRISGFSLSAQQSNALFNNSQGGGLSDVNQQFFFVLRKDPDAKLYLTNVNQKDIAVPSGIATENKHLGYTKDTINYLSAYLKQVTQPCSLYMDSSEEINPFLDYANLEEAAYFKSYIEWQEMTKWDETKESIAAQNPNYILRVFDGRYIVVRPESPLIPVFQASLNTKKDEAFKVMDALKTISRWENCLRLSNRHPAAKEFLQEGDTDKLKLEVSVGGQVINIQPNINASAPFFSLTGAPLTVMYKKEVANYVAPLDIKIIQGGTDDLFIGALILGADFEIMSIVPGDSVEFPPYNQAKNRLGLSIQKQILYPGMLMDKKVNNGYGLKTLTIYLKIFLAHKRFDITEWQQDALLMPNKIITIQQPTGNDALRAVLSRKKGEGAGDWLAVTIPIQLQAPLHEEGDNKNSTKPYTRGLNEEEEYLK